MDLVSKEEDLPPFFKSIFPKVLMHTVYNHTPRQFEHVHFAECLEFQKPTKGDGLRMQT